MNRELVKAAQDGLAIIDVYLRESHSVFLDADYDPKLAGPKLAFQHKFVLKRLAVLEASVDQSSNFQLARFYVGTGFRLLPPDLPNEAKEQDQIAKHAMAEITAEFVSEYKIINENLAKEAMDEFGKYNTMLHIWPYWREFIHSTCGRMYLPQLVLPMYRVPKSPVNEGKTAEAGKKKPAQSRNA